jgi:hypothetical protein
VNLAGFFDEVRSLDVAANLGTRACSARSVCFLFFFLNMEMAVEVKVALAVAEMADLVRLICLLFPKLLLTFGPGPLKNLQVYSAASKYRLIDKFMSALARSLDAIAVPSSPNSPVLNEERNKASAVAREPAANRGGPAPGAQLHVEPTRNICERTVASRGSAA